MWVPWRVGCVHSGQWGGEKQEQDGEWSQGTAGACGHFGSFGLAASAGVRLSGRRGVQEETGTTVQVLLVEWETAWETALVLYEHDSDPRSGGFHGVQLDRSQCRDGVSQPV